MKIRFILLGRTRRAEMRALFEDYVARLGRFTEVEVQEYRDAAAFARRKSERGANFVLLDAGGDEPSSQKFAQWLGKERDSGAREFSFLCGDAVGFPEPVRALARRKLSLSAFTLSHELARVVLAEQLYRAFAILAGHPYPK
jgi:23S rRNA (pseudouridine1915-N3)-methyltransferase